MIERERESKKKSEHKRKSAWAPVCTQQERQNPNGDDEEEIYAIFGIRMGYCVTLGHTYKGKKLTIGSHASKQTICLAYSQRST